MSISIVTHEDNIQMMGRYTEGFFDLAVVDPEYGIDAGNMTMGKGSRNDLGKNKAKNWDKKAPEAAYFDELFRVSKNQIIWGGNYFIDFLYSTPCFLIWDKKDPNSDFASCEMAWTSFDKPTKTYYRARNMGDEIKIHPTQKSRKLYVWALKYLGGGCKTILDTHVGSGSSRIAAYDLGFDFYGCELDKDYYEAQEKRFQQHTSQTKLFIPQQEIIQTKLL